MIFPLFIGAPLYTGSLSLFSSTSTHNQEIKRKIVQEIKDVPGVSYTEEEIKGKNV